MPSIEKKAENAVATKMLDDLSGTGEVTGHWVAGVVSMVTNFCIQNLHYCVTCRQKAVENERRGQRPMQIEREEGR